MLAPVEGWPAAAPWVEGKVRSTRGGCRGRFRKMKEPSFPNGVPAGWGLSSRRACAREKPTAVSLQPQKACAHTLLHTHTHSHTLARARARAPAGTSAWLHGAESTRPTPAVVPRPRQRPPLSTPRKPLDVGVARHSGSAQPERPSPLCAADATPRQESSGG